MRPNHDKIKKKKKKDSQGDQSMNKERKKERTYDSEGDQIMIKEINKERKICIKRAREYSLDIKTQ